MAPATKKKRQPTKDVAVVSTKDEPLTKKHCTCTCIDGINGEQTITIKFSGNMDTRASSSKSKEPVTSRAPPVKSKAPVTPRMPRSNKGQLPSVPEPRTPITRSKKQQLLSVQEPSMLDVLHSRQDPATVPFARKWSNNDKLRILRGLQEHRELHGKLPDLAVLYDKITRDGSFDNQDAGMPEFKDKVRKLLRLYKKMVPMKDPKGDDHKIELFRISCNVWGDYASNAHAHGANVDAGIDAAAAAALNNAHAHGLAAPLGAHAGVVASPDAAPAPAAPLDAHAGMGASTDDPPAPATPLAAHAGTGASPDALAAPATVGMPLPVKRAVSSPAALVSPAALACACPAAPARASPAAPAHAMLLPSGTTTASCANSRDEDKLSQWLRVVLRWGSRVAFLLAFAAFMSPGWREGGYKEFMELGGLLP